jgi:hypothetical protein
VTTARVSPRTSSRVVAHIPTSTPAAGCGIVVVLALGALALTAWGVGGSMSDYYASIALSMSGAGRTSSSARSTRRHGDAGQDPRLVLDPRAVREGARLLALGGHRAERARRDGIRRDHCRHGAALGGSVAGLVAGGVVATTPILVAVARSNQPETFFVLASRSRRGRRRSARGQPRWLVLAGVFIAAAFQTYMLEAWAVWPALAVAYLCTRQSWSRRVGHLAIAGVAASRCRSLDRRRLARPGIRPSVHRQHAHQQPVGDGVRLQRSRRFGSSTADASAYRSFTPFSGEPSVLRLLNEAGCTDRVDAPGRDHRRRHPVRPALRSRAHALRYRVVRTFAAMFSAVAGMHQFYTASLAVPVALLVGAAFAIARRRHALWAQLALIGIAAVTAIGIGFVGNGGAAFSRRSPSCSSSSRPSPVRSPSGSGAAECGCRSPQSSPRSRSS